jgi:dolichol-phosphate mannosyltransferase
MANPCITGRCRNDLPALTDNNYKTVSNTIRSPGGNILDQNSTRTGMECCTLVIPAYNEEERIQFLLSDIEGNDARYIFVCDGQDGTVSKIREFEAAHPGMKIQCLEYPFRLGKGKAIREGLSLAKTRLAGYMDADGSTASLQMMALFNELEGFDGIIGSRWVDGAEIIASQGLFRRLESRVFNMVIRILFNLPYYDTQCGAKVFRKEALDAVLPTIVSKGFEFDVELLWRLRKHGYIVREYPIEWKNRGASRVNGQDAFSMLGNLLKMRFGRDIK